MVVLEGRVTWHCASLKGKVKYSSTFEKFVEKIVLSKVVDSDNFHGWAPGIFCSREDSCKQVRMFFLVTLEGVPRP